MTSNAPSGSLPFWEAKSLQDMTDAEWESLCDGCGRCCLHKLEDIDTGAIYYTDVACRLLDTQTCRCQQYASRTQWVRDCLTLDPATVGDVPWLPSTCAYRLVAEGRRLPDWHPLVSGDPQTVHDAGISVAGMAVPETEAEDLQEHILDKPF